MDIDKLRDEGIENATRNQLEEALRISLERGHILNWVAHKALDTASLEGRCGLIVGGLADEFSDKGNGYRFDFDAVGLYASEEDGILRLCHSKGLLPDVIEADNPMAGYREHLEFGTNGTEYSEIIIPLVANEEFQGLILINNEKSKRPIDFKEYFNFFHAYGDMAAGAIYSAKVHERVVEEREKAARLLESLQGLTHRIAHDLKTPLVAMGGFAKRLQKNLQKELDSDNQDHDIEGHKSYADIIVTATVRMEASLTDFLGFLELESGYQPDMSGYELNNAIGSISKRLEEKAEASGMAISYSHDSSTEEIETDKGLVNSILENLVVNAINHGEPGRIDVIAERDENGVYIRVTNNGYIPDTEEIFKPFFTTHEKGTGLGLDIIRRNAELLGGYINVRNITEEEPPRVCFEIYLPQDC